MAVFFLCDWVFGRVCWCVCVCSVHAKRETRCLTRVVRKWLRNLAREEEKETRSLFVNCFTDSFPPSLVCPFRRTGWPFGRDSLEGLALDSQLFSSLLVCRVVSAVCMSSKDEFRAPALGLFFGYLAVLTLLSLLLLFAGRFFGWRRVLISVLHVWLFPLNVRKTVSSRKSQMELPSSCT